MTVDAIKEAIAQLPVEEQASLASWLSSDSAHNAALGRCALLERDWQAWEEEIEADFSAGGRGLPLLAQLEREIAEGGSSSSVAPPVVWRGRQP